MQKTFGQIYAAELLSEADATRKCIQVVPESLYEYKPHEKSMKMGNLVQAVAGIPDWIRHIVEVGDVDFHTYKLDRPTTTEDIVKFFDKNLAGALKALESVSDEDLEKSFSLKMGDQVLMTGNKNDTIRDTINHLAHHRGQLTVYIRMNNIPVPKIYGPSGDDTKW